MPKVHTHLESIDAESFDLLEQEMCGLTEYPGTDDDGWLLGTLDEVEDLMALSRRSGLAVRFRDRGFPINTAWHWLGDGVGVAHMITANGIGQIHLMLAGTETEERPVARAWLKLAGIIPDTALPTTRGPALITLEREGYSDEAGSYLLGMILIAPFCDACGVPNDPA